MKIHRPRKKPVKLGQKLLQIREALGLSQSELIRKLGVEGTLQQQDISNFERGSREPDLRTLLEYSRISNVCLNLIADDAHDLPTRIPVPGKLHVPR